MNINRKSLTGSLMLIIAAAIWGAAFVAQSVGMEYIGPFTLNCIRMLIGGAVLVPAIFVFDKIGICHRPTDKKQRRFLIIGGVSCGCVLAAASMMQQIGIKYTSPGKAGFITAIYIVLIPIMQMTLGRKTHWSAWISVLIAAAGMYLLCINGEFVIKTGDVCVIMCAFLFAAHIMVTDHFAPGVDCVRMSCIQFFTCGAVCGIFMLIFEEPTLEGIAAARIPILYTGICSSGIAYTLQTVAQSKVKPVIASLLMSLESVFSVVFSMLILNQRLTLRELCGCILIFAAVIFAQIIPQKSGE